MNLCGGSLCVYTVHVQGNGYQFTRVDRSFNKLNTQYNLCKTQFIDFTKLD